MGTRSSAKKKMAPCCCFYPPGPCIRTDLIVVFLNLKATPKGRRHRLFQLAAVVAVGRVEHALFAVHAPQSGRSAHHDAQQRQLDPHVALQLVAAVQDHHSRLRRFVSADLGQANAQDADQRRKFRLPDKLLALRGCLTCSHCRKMST